MAATIQYRLNNVRLYCIVARVINQHIDGLYRIIGWDGKNFCFCLKNLHNLFKFAQTEFLPLKHW